MRTAVRLDASLILADIAGNFGSNHSTFTVRSMNFPSSRLLEGLSPRIVLPFVQVLQDDIVENFHFRERLSDTYTERTSEKRWPLRSNNGFKRVTEATELCRKAEEA